MKRRGAAAAEMLATSSKYCRERDSVLNEVDGAFRTENRISDGRGLLVRSLHSPLPPSLSLPFPFDIPTVAPRRPVEPSRLSCAKSQHSKGGDGCDGPN